MHILTLKKDGKREREKNIQMLQLENSHLPTWEDGNSTEKHIHQLYYFF